VQALADLPTLDELRSKLLSVLNGPASKFVRVLNAVPQQVVTLLTAYEDKLKEGGE
jgi:large subunit ribosomal protein L10